MSCTPQHLIDTCDECDQDWASYKQGYERCVRNAAQYYWQKYACGPEAITGLNLACRACKQQFRK